MINEKGQFIKGHKSTCGFKKGSAGFTGRHSLETKEKMRLAKLGKSPPNKGKTKKDYPNLSNSGVKIGNIPWNEGKKYPAISGENHHNWNGGVTPINEKIRQSLEYKIWRMSVFKRDNFTCIQCGDSSGGNLNADHIKAFCDFPDLRFDVSNGRTLCIECHKKTDNYLWKSQMLKRKKNGN